MTAVKNKRKAIPMTPDVIRKFKEHNEKLAIESKVLNYINAINSILDTHGEVMGFMINSEDIGLVDKIKLRLQNAGWTVDSQNCSLSVWID